MKNRYESDANSALAAGIPAATPELTVTHWEALGVTRQTEWRWRTYPSQVPLMARLAAAWLMHKGQG